MAAPATAPQPDSDRAPRVGGRRSHGEPARTDTPEAPLLSVITVAYNAGPGLESTIQSVQSQRYENYEHIVIDGGSTDGSPDVLRKYDQDLAYWVSEPDAGIYHAMNKGIAAARGRYIGLLNADTRFVDCAVLELVAETARRGTWDVIYGDQVQWEPDIERSLYVRSSLNLSREMTLSHEAMFVSRDTYQRVGPYDTGYRITADYEYGFRLLKAGVTFCRIPKPLIIYASGGMSDTMFFPTNQESIRLLAHEAGVRAAASFGLRVGRRFVFRSMLAALRAAGGDEAHHVLKRSFVEAKRLLFRKYRPR
jgi:glycosyltransferase involved in cell wall biosynthesis